MTPNETSKIERRKAEARGIMAEPTINKLRAMNPEQAAALFRTVLQVAGGIVATWGFMSDAQWTAISGGLLTVAITTWGIYARRDTALVESAANVPAVQTIVADPVVASDALREVPNVVLPKL